MTKDLRDILTGNWENNLGAMNQAFEWTPEEERMLDDAYCAGNYGRSPFCDNLDGLCELLRSLVKSRLYELSEVEQDPEYREWLLQNSR